MIFNIIIAAIIVSFTYVIAKRQKLMEILGKKRFHLNHLKTTNKIDRCEIYMVELTIVLVLSVAMKWVGVL